MSRWACMASGVGMDADLALLATENGFPDPRLDLLELHGQAAA